MCESVNLKKMEQEKILKKKKKNKSASWKRQVQSTFFIAIHTILPTRIYKYKLVRILPSQSVTCGNILQFIVQNPNKDYMINPMNQIFMMKLYPRETPPEVQE
jgi:hypothetical protein